LRLVWVEKYSKDGDLIEHLFQDKSSGRTIADFIKNPDLKSKYELD